MLAVTATMATTSFANERMNESKIALGTKIGTTGVGIEVRTILTESLYGRLGGSYFHYNHSLTKGDLKYKGKMTLLSVPLMLDYHPFEESGFRLSAGVAYNGNEVKATAKPTVPVTINNHIYTIADIGEVNATLSLQHKIAPVVTIGYDSSFVNNSSWSFNAEAGVMYLGKPKIKVSASGLAASNQNLINDLDKDINKNLKQVKKYLRFFPVVSFGLKYNF